jgi:hypothetical protein
MDRIEFLKTNKYPNLDPSIVDAAVLADPTSEKKFADWILRMHSKWGLRPTDFPSLTDILSSYNSVRGRMPEEKRDVNKFASPLELSNAIVGFIRSEMSGAKKSSGDNKAVYDIIFENDKWVVIRPLTFEAELKYGKSTKWCTAGKDSRATFYSYMSGGYLYIVIDKTLPDKDPLSKMQFQFNGRHGGGMFMNALDEHVEILTFLKQNKEIWEAFLNANEFDGSNNAYYKLVHNPQTIDKNAQLSALRAFGLDALSMITNPCNELEDEAIQRIVQENSWEKITLLADIIAKKRIQTKMVNYALERKDFDEKIAIKVISSFNSMNVYIYHDAFEPLVKKYPESVFAFGHTSSTLETINENLLEVALSEKPELIKNTECSKELIVKFAIKVPRILEHVKVKQIEFSADEIRKISKSKDFEAHMLRKFSIVPEDVQIAFIKKDFENSQYIKGLTDKAKQIRKELKKDYEAERKKYEIEEKKKLKDDWGLPKTYSNWDCNGYGEYDGYDSYDDGRYDFRGERILKVTKTSDGDFITLCEDCNGRKFWVKSKNRHRYYNI